jgi:hypothetical protein
LDGKKMAYPIMNATFQAVLHSDAALFFIALDMNMALDVLFDLIEGK